MVAEEHSFGQQGKPVQAFKAIHFALSTAFITFHISNVVFSLPHSKTCFLVSFVIYSLTHGLFRRVIFNFQIIQICY